VRDKDASERDQFGPTQRTGPSPTSRNHFREVEEMREHVVSLDGRRLIADARQALLDDFRLKRLPSTDVYLRLGAIEEGRLF